MNFLKHLFSKKQTGVTIKYIETPDGFTTIFTSPIDTEEEKRREEEMQAFLGDAARKITPCTRSVQEICDYICKEYNGVPYVLSPREEEHLKANIIVNCFPEVLEQPKELPKNPTEKEIVHHTLEDTTFEQAKNYPAETLGLEFLVFTLPNYNVNLFEKKQKFLRFRKGKQAQLTIEDARIELEYKTGYICFKNCEDALVQDFRIWYGVSQEDIDTRSGRFVTYVEALKDAKKL